MAYKLVHSALNGNSDPHVIELIDRCLNKNKKGLLYPDLPDKRDLLKLAPDLYEQHNRDYVLNYLINELTDNNAHVRQDKKNERKQKYVIAAIGATTTIISTASALLIYFLEK